MANPQITISADEREGIRQAMLRGYENADMMKIIAAKAADFAGDVEDQKTADQFNELWLMSKVIAERAADATEIIDKINTRLR